MSLSNAFFAIVWPSDEITTPPPFPSINHWETFAQNRAEKYSRSSVSTKYDFDAVLSKEMPVIDSRARGFSKEIPVIDTEDWHFSKEMPAIDTEDRRFSKEMSAINTKDWRFSEEMPAIDTEDRHFSREMHVFDIIGLWFQENPYRDLK